MYRARVQAVSGTKVFADGKCLQCIGNKTFHVGELIYTDGRCAYGNWQIPQQPLVITPPNVEEVPILSGKNLYSFANGKLKLVVELEKAYQLMINDTKGNVYVYDEKTGSKIIDNTKERLENANIDKAGNMYYLTRLGEFDGIYDYAGDIRLLKNKKEFNSFSLISATELQLNTVTQPPHVRSQWEADYEEYDYIITGAYLYSNLIENENNWHFIYELSTAKGWEDPAGRKNENDTLTLNYLSQGKKIILAEALSEKRRLLDYNRYEYNHYDANYNSAKILLHNGYYYEITPHPLTKWYETGLKNTFYYKTFFTPSGKKIFEIIGYARSPALISRVRGGYLFYTEWFSLDLNATSNTISNTIKPYGLYFFHNGTFEPLLLSNIANKTLRPMRKIKNWHKRIKEINLNETA